jgi:hypothetical protein
MKTKEPVKIKKQTVAVKDLKTRKNPKGGAIAKGRTIASGGGISITALGAGLGTLGAGPT